MRQPRRRMRSVPGRSARPVPEPVHIRFAWHRNPLHNLYNREKLPAVPFRTDRFDLLSKPR